LRWKFEVHGISPIAPFTTTSDGGGSYYPAGTVVTLPVSLVGHRDLWPTICPGDGIWDHLDELRSQVAYGLTTAPTTPTTTTTVPSVGIQTSPTTAPTTTTTTTTTPAIQPPSR
jgi:hypothetical protein